MGVSWNPFCSRTLLSSLFLWGLWGCDSPGSGPGRSQQPPTPAADAAVGGAAKSDAGAAKSEGGLQVTKDPLFSVGEVPPPLKLKNMAGEEVSLESWKGKVVLLNFWATWCVPCVAEMPALERLYKTYKDQGLEVVAVSVDQDAKLADVEKFLKSNGITFTVLRDPEFTTPTTFGLTGFPESFFLSREGKLVSIEDPSDHAISLRVVGDRPWDSPAFVKAVGELVTKNGPGTTLASSSK